MLDRKEFYGLMERVQRDPSVLFLGQDYLKSMSGKNLFHETVYNHFKNQPMPEKMTYNGLWELSEDDNRANDKFYDILRTAAGDISPQQNFKKIMALRWNMVYTTAIDGLINAIGNNLTIHPVVHSDNNFKGEYLSKSILNTVFLYGSVNSSENERPPETCDEDGLFPFEGNIKAKIRWIYEKILRDYGVLIIDGWNPERDWLDTLLNDATDMYPDSIYLFGISPEEISPNNKTLNILIKRNIVVCDKRSFSEVIKENEYFDEIEDIYEENAEVAQGYKKVTINKFSVPIDETALANLDSHITLMDDDIGNDTRGYDDKGEAFLKFLQQASVPAWPLYNPRFKFYFKRDKEKDLETRIDDLLYKKRRSVDRSFVCLKGYSNTGKSTLLAHLALKLRDKHKYPVFFINGSMQSSEFEVLKGFIKKYFTSPVDRREGIAKYVVIIWDDSKNPGCVKAYEELQSELAECNVLVIGSAYRRAEANQIDIEISPSLSSEEERLLKEMLESVDESLKLLRQYESIRTKEKSNHWFYILDELARYSYDPQWREVAQNLRERTIKEIITDEELRKESLEKFEEDFESEINKVKENVIKHGAQAAWKMKLEEYKRQLENGVEDAKSESISKKQEKLKAVERASNKLDQVTRLLAIAGQFDVYLPLGLLLRFIFGFRFDLDNKLEWAFIDDVLRTDGLFKRKVDDGGYVKISYRHFREAEVYMEHYFGKKNLDTEQRKAEEVEILCNLIEKCKWDDTWGEAFDVISLIRKFGPNSLGKMSERDAAHNRNNYLEYEKYWTIIAEYLYKKTDAPEAILVYAHFMRESGEDPAKFENKLKSALDNLKNDDTRRERILGELCANLNAQMENNFEDHKFRKLKEFFKELVNFKGKYKKSYNNENYTTNSLLDTWLNAIIYYYKHIGNDGKAFSNEKFMSEVSASYTYIDKLFDVKDKSGRYDGMMNNINTIYTLMDKLLKNENAGIKDFIDKLEKNNNDLYIHMKARSFWRSGQPLIKKGTSNGEEIIITQNEWIEWDLYLLPDDAKEDDYQKLEEYRKKAILCAIETVKQLEAKKSLIEKSDSERCVEMLIRSKWLLYSGYFPLEENQYPGLKIKEMKENELLPTKGEEAGVLKNGWLGYVTKEQWREINGLCEEYIKYCNKKDILPKPFTLFLRAVYAWKNNPNKRTAIDYFNEVERTIRKGSNWMIDRLILCHENTCEPIIYSNFTVTVGKNNNLYAEINEGEEKGRYNLRIGNDVEGYLFKGKPGNKIFRKGDGKEVIIRFSARGENIGIAPLPPNKELDESGIGGRRI